MLAEPRLKRRWQLMGSEKKGNTKMRCLFFGFWQYLMYIFGFKITYEVKGLIFCKLLASSSLLLSSLPRICGRSLAKSVQYPRSYGPHSASLKNPVSRAGLHLNTASRGPKVCQVTCRCIFQAVWQNLLQRFSDTISGYVAAYVS